MVWLDFEVKNLEVSVTKFGIFGVLLGSEIPSMA